MNVNERVNCYLCLNNYNNVSMLYFVIIYFRVNYLENFISMFYLKYL